MSCFRQSQAECSNEPYSLRRWSVSLDNSTKLFKILSQVKNRPPLDVGRWRTKLQITKLISLGVDWKEKLPDFCCQSKSWLNIFFKFHARFDAPTQIEIDILVKFDKFDRVKIQRFQLKLGSELGLFPIFNIDWKNLIWDLNCRSLLQKVIISEQLLPIS